MGAKQETSRLVGNPCKSKQVGNLGFCTSTLRSLILLAHSLHLSLNLNIPEYFDWPKCAKVGFSGCFFGSPIGCPTKKGRPMGPHWSKGSCPEEFKEALRLDPSDIDILLKYEELYKCLDLSSCVLFASGKITGKA